MHVGQVIGWHLLNHILCEKAVHRHPNCWATVVYWHLRPSAPDVAVALVSAVVVPLVGGGGDGSIVVAVVGMGAVEHALSAVDAHREARPLAAVQFLRFYELG